MKILFELLAVALTFWTIGSLGCGFSYFFVPNTEITGEAMIFYVIVEIILSVAYMLCAIRYYNPEYQEKMKKAQEDWEKYQAGAAERRQLREKYELEKTAKQPARKKNATERGKDLATLGCIGAILYFPIGVILALAKKYSK